MDSGVAILAPSLISCVALGELLKLSMSVFSFLFSILKVVIMKVVISLDGCV